MIRKEKTVTWQLSFDMPEEYGLEAVADRIGKVLKRSIESDKDLWGGVIFSGGCILVDEVHHGEVIR